MYVNVINIYLQVFTRSILQAIGASCMEFYRELQTSSLDFMLLQCHKESIPQLRKPRIQRLPGRRRCLIRYFVWILNMTLSCVLSLGFHILSISVLSFLEKLFLVLTLYIGVTLIYVYVYSKFKYYLYMLVGNQNLIFSYEPKINRLSGLSFRQH